MNKKFLAVGILVSLSLSDESCGMLFDPKINRIVDQTIKADQSDGSSSPPLVARSIYGNPTLHFKTTAAEPEKITQQTSQAPADAGIPLSPKMLQAHLLFLKEMKKPRTETATTPIVRPELPTFADKSTISAHVKVMKQLKSELNGTDHGDAGHNLLPITIDEMVPTKDNEKPRLVINDPNTQMTRTKTYHEQEKQFTEMVTGPNGLLIFNLYDLNHNLIEQTHYDAQCIPIDIMKCNYNDRGELISLKVTDFDQVNVFFSLDQEQIAAIASRVRSKNPNISQSQINDYFVTLRDNQEGLGKVQSFISKTKKQKKIVTNPSSDNTALLNGHSPVTIAASY